MNPFQLAIRTKSDQYKRLTRTSPLTSGLVENREPQGMEDQPEKEFDIVSHHHEAVVGSGGTLRSSDPALEPQNEAVHIRRAQRNLHY